MGNAYERENRKKLAIILCLGIFLCLSALAFMVVRTDISAFSIPELLLRAYTGGPLSAQEKIILYMRMPAVLMAIAAGLALSVSGGVMQSVTHNDLVSPFTLGVSAAAAFGASLCIVWGNAAMHSAAGLIAGAFLSSCICILMVYGLSLKTGTTA